MDEERIALYLDYENLAIGARQALGRRFDLGPVADALAERGRVVVRRAYADWSMFVEDRRDLTRHYVELIDIPQKMGYARKNAADIKLAVDALELSFAADYVTTFVVGTGDSDFTPLVHKLRERNKKVIGFGVQRATSDLLPPACDEFLFYDRLEGVGPAKSEVAEEQPVASDTDEGRLQRLVAQTLSGLKRTSGDVVLSSQLKRAILRKASTFDEADLGFRGFRELLTHLASKGVVELRDGPARGDPEVDFPTSDGSEDDAVKLLREVVEASSARGPVPLSGLKRELRKRQSDFSEKRFGYGGFLQFCKAAKSRGAVEMSWDDQTGDYLLSPVR